MPFKYRHVPYSQLLQLSIVASLLAVSFMAFNPLQRLPYKILVVHSHPAFISDELNIFPAGGRTLFPSYRLIALYGTPNYPVLGALGQQSLLGSITRAKALASQYQPLMSEYAFPAFEIIATVASASPTANGNYSRNLESSQLSNWVLTAQRSGVYVVLDLQPGRNDFLTQAQQYQYLLEQPYVGLALDPEWRLTPTELPLQQIGTVSIEEINETAQWLAQLTQQRKLPQKLFLLHEFRLSMIQNRSELNTEYPELAYVVQMDGQGTQPEKLTSWEEVTASSPPNVHFGWKNFYAKDTPLATPQQTMQLDPKPWYASYQ
jgi:hypothetical protein